MIINLVIPIHNEEAILEENVRKVLEFIVRAYGHTPLRFQIILADNGSTDKTGEIARTMVGATSCGCPQNQGDHMESPLQYIFIPQKGKGLAIKQGWQKFPADYYVFMDADLSTDLEALPRLIEELDKGADMVIGSRYLPESKTTRSASRKFISLIYRWLARRWLGLPFSDLPCGFKGVNQKVVVGANDRLPTGKAGSPLLSQVKNNEWFFDTELLYRAHQGGYKIKEIPVIWTEKSDKRRKSRVGLIKVSLMYLKELIKLKNIGY